MNSREKRFVIQEHSTDDDTHWDLMFETKNILQSIKGIKFVFFSKTDVVRHKLVQDIIKAYEELEEAKMNDNASLNDTASLT